MSLHLYNFRALRRFVYTVKVKELMVLCDLLQANLKEAQTTQLHLTEAVAEQAANLRESNV